jgi:hypothetical protein
MQQKQYRPHLTLDQMQYLYQHIEADMINNMVAREIEPYFRKLLGSSPRSSGVVSNLGFTTATGEQIVGKSLMDQFKEDKYSLGRSQLASLLNHAEYFTLSQEDQHIIYTAYQNVAGDKEQEKIASAFAQSAKNTPKDPFDL